jgi:type VI secretion system protein ImpK
MELKTQSYRMAGTLTELSAEILALIVNLRRTIAFKDHQELRSKIKSTFQTMTKEAARLKIPESDVEEVKKLLTAFIDETVLISQWPAKEEWRRSPLALEMFRTVRVGDEVFDRLAVTRKEEPLRADVLEVYFTCLALGFKGRMIVEGEEALNNLLVSIWNDLQRVRKDREYPPLAPTGLPADAAPNVAAPFNVWLFAGILAASLIVLIIGLDVVLGIGAKQVAGSLQNLLL